MKPPYHLGRLSTHWACRTDYVEVLVEKIYERTGLRSSGLRLVHSSEDVDKYGDVR